jgi:Na+/melibiose symporter-like transporter
MPKFYFFGICYMGVRLYVNMFGTFLPFYLEGVIKLGTEDNGQVPFTVALVPLIVYLSSVIVSWYLDKFYEMFGRKKALLIGTIICCISLGSMFLIDESTNWVIYILAIFIGCSQTMVLSTGINFISDVVGTKAKTGAFVFGCYSLLDKFSAGIVIYLVGSA